MDLSFYQRLECCFLYAAEETLMAAGLPIPSRVEGVYHGVKGNPVCCDALIVSIGSARNPQEGQERAKNCGPGVRDITVEVRIFRDHCPLKEDECGDDSPGPCGPDVPIVCPGEPWPEPPTDDPCSIPNRAWTNALMMADRTALELGVCQRVAHCLCSNEWFEDCDIECHSSCDDAVWVSSEPISGGFCAGTKLTFVVRIVGSGSPA